MSAEACQYLMERFDNAIDHCRSECDITHIEVVGCLERVKYDMLNEMIEKEDEDDAN